jgi:hypothetical protein
LMIILGAACLNESSTTSGDAAGLLPTDIPEQPAGADGGAASSTEIRPLIPSEFIFRRGTQVLAYDLASNTERGLFDGKDLTALDLSPNRQSFVAVKDTPSSQIAPILSVSLDGRRHMILRAVDVNISSEITYRLYSTNWSADGSKIFFQFTIVGLPASGGSFNDTHANYFSLSDSKGAKSACKTDGSIRAHPTDPNRVLIYLKEACGVPHAGLTEYTVSPFLPVKLLVPATEFGPKLFYEWLYDGSIVYLAKDGSLLHLDASGGKSVYFKPDSTHTVDNFASGPAGESIASLYTVGVDAKDPPTNIYRVFPDTGAVTQLTTDGNSFWPKW